MMAVAGWVVCNCEGADDGSAPFFVVLCRGGVTLPLRLILAQHLLQRQSQAGDTLADDFRL